MIDIYVGGLNDDDNNWVSSYQKEYGGKNSVYYEWSDSDDILAKMKEVCCENPDEPINLIGHSWGGDTVAQIAANWDGNCPIGILVTADPVSLWKPDFNKVSENTSYWININANPSNPNASDTWVAKPGGKWGEKPKPYADHYYEVDANHENFHDLMKKPPIM